MSPIDLNSVSQSLRRMWWYITDRRWRKSYLVEASRIRSLKARQSEAYDSLWRQTNGQIAVGPFQGLTYLDNQSGIYPQKLLGTYEKELWPAVEAIAARDYSLIVDLGAAEGYYVCGLARRIPQARVIGFEAQHACHRYVRDLARRNGVLNRIECRGHCSALDLQSVLSDGQRTLVVCDVEGAEDDVLVPDLVPGLRHVDILVEVHDHIRPDVGARLLRRFSDTHDIQIFHSRPRQMRDIPTSVSLSDDLAMAAMNESRHPESKWFVCWARRLQADFVASPDCD
jgi:hypothetical protein